MTWSASSVDIPCPVDRLDPELDRQKGEELRRPQSGYSVHSSVASTREIEKHLNSATRTLLGVTHCGYSVHSSVASTHEIEKSLNSAARTVLGVTHCNAHAPY